MATKLWRGDAPAIKQVEHFTPAGVAAGDTFTISINGKGVSYTTAAGTVADVCTGLQGALATSAIPEFGEVLWTQDGSKVIGTSASPGRPFVASASTTGSGTVTQAQVAVSSGPNDWSVAANWRPSGVPGAGDDVIVANDVDVLYGLDQTAAGTLASLTWTQNATAKLGLPKRNPAGYEEYRETRLRINVGVVNVGTGDFLDLGRGTGRFKIDCLATQTTVNLLYLASPSDPGAPGALSFSGTHVGNVFNAFSGRLAVGVDGAATLATLRVGSGNGNPSGTLVYLDPSTSVTTIALREGTLLTACAPSSLAMTGGEWQHLAGSGTIADAYVWGGHARYASGQPIAHLRVGRSGVFDCSRVTRARTIAACSLFAGGTILDPHASVTWTTGIALGGCDLRDVTIHVGNGRTYSVV